jgi:hypothetical protein
MSEALNWAFDNDTITKSGMAGAFMIERSNDIHETNQKPWNVAFLLLSLVALGLVGCGQQRGRFSTSTDRARGFSSHVGYIQIVSGNRLGLLGINKGDEEDLLYLLVVCPRTKSHGSSSGADYGKYVTTLSHSWQTEAGTISVDVRWDRSTDVVSLGTEEFVREKGNFFVVRLETDEKTSIQ